LENRDCVYRCLDPRGNPPDIEYLPPSKRLAALDDKTVFFVDIGKPGSDVLLKTAMEMMEKRVPSARLVYYPKNTSFMKPESEEWWKTIEERADAAIVALGD
jgi:hypothetical protein